MMLPRFQELCRDTLQHARDARRKFISTLKASKFTYDMPFYEKWAETLDAHLNYIGQCIETGKCDAEDKRLVEALKYLSSDADVKYHLRTTESDNNTLPEMILETREIIPGNIAHNVALTEERHLLINQLLSVTLGAESFSMLMSVPFRTAAVRVAR